MLPSMPILFSNSQDAFGNKVEQSTSFFSQSWFQKPPETPAPPLAKASTSTAVEELPKAVKEAKGKARGKKLESTATPPKVNENALETALVKNYYKKVQSKFSSNLNVPTNKFIQFQTALKSFDPTKETPVDLYKKIELIFGESSEVVEEFLLFLKPGQAAQVGRLMDYFVMTRLSTFIDDLNKAYARKPTVYRKILRALNNGINTGNSGQMKARVLPHLRSNAKLAQTFRALFPDERPPDSYYEVGEDMLDESFLTRDIPYDTWELPGTSDDRRKLHPTSIDDTMYLHGRVFLQHGRMLRPARVTFPYSKEPYRVHARRLAPNLDHLSPPDSDEECSPKRGKATPKIPIKRTRKPPKSPTKTPKDVNHNTNTSKECVNSPKNKKPIKRTNKKSESETNKVKKESKNVKKDSNQEATKAKQARIDVYIDKTSDDKISVDVRKTEVICTNTEAKNIKLAITTADAMKIDTPTIPSTTCAMKIDTMLSTPDAMKIDTEAMTTTYAMIIETPTIPSTSDGITVVTQSTDAIRVDTQSTKTENNDSNTNGAEKKSNWTRDEDKTMLQVLKGEAGSEQIFGKIKEMLPHRSPSEIKERFCHVMNLLQQMAVGEVT